MKHYVLGLIYNITLDHIILIEKKEPKWMKGFWNGVGGKINDDETPAEAIHRETEEELKCSFAYEHMITFVCPGGTVFVYKAISTNITPFGNILKYSGNWNDVSEPIKIFSLDGLPEKLMADLKWMIPLSLSTVQFPIPIIQNELGII